MKKSTENGQPVEKLTNKAEAVRRALTNLGDNATPTEIQSHIKERYDVEMTTKVISVYKSKLAKRKGRAGRKARIEQPAAASSPASNLEAISLHDLRALKQLKDRHGLSRLRELLELVSI